ncbi:MAG: NUDIX domain-containing protein [Cyanothece sp. SIO1E1]|nr:NUDIX domain-containing protein [Cyanothece sp. SIO1E1]
MTQPLVEVAIAILYQQGQFLLQLRDNRPGIVYPGCWGFFGGHLEPDETPEAGLRRELIEEIGYSPPVLTAVGCYASANVLRHVYHAPLTVQIKDLVLQEGWDLGLLTPEDIQRGDRYSAKAGQVRPLGKPHQQILLDFLAQDVTITGMTHE